MISLVIFRQNLRLRDNPMLALASQSNHQILPLVLINKSDWQRKTFEYESMGPFREPFFYDCCHGLNESLNDREGELWVSEAPLETTLNELNTTIGIAQIITTQEVGFYEGQFEEQLQAYGKKNNIPVSLIWDNTLIHPDDLPFHRLETPNSFSSFRKKIERTRLQLPAEVDVDGVFYSGPNQYPISKGFPEVGSRHSNVGEKAAWQHLNNYIWESKAILHYKETRNLSIGDHVSTKFSIWLSMGVLSSRQIIREIKNSRKK